MDADKRSSQTPAPGIASRPRGPRGRLKLSGRRRFSRYGFERPEDRRVLEGERVPKRISADPGSAGPRVGPAPTIGHDVNPDNVRREAKRLGFRSRRPTALSRCNYRSQANVGLPLQLAVSHTSILKIAGLVLPSVSSTVSLPSYDARFGQLIVETSSLISPLQPETLPS